MTSIKPTNDGLERSESCHSWRLDGLRYRTLGHMLRSRFGGRVQKVSLDAGFTCPNVDGSVAIGGCTFCDNRSFSPSRRVRRRDIQKQIDQGIQRLKLRYKVDQFIAYFQPATNTYAPVERLREVYQAALDHDAIVGIAIGTRPDCVPDEVLDLLQELAEQTYVSVEYGIQTIHDRSLIAMNRGHLYDVFPDAIQRSENRGFDICAHVIIGLPDESHADIMATIDEMANQNLDAIKIHNLYVVKNTRLAEQLTAGELKLMDQDTFVQTVVDAIERLPPHYVIERVSGDAPPEYFLGPEWATDKSAILNAIASEFAQRDTYQGTRYVPRSVTR